MKKFLILFTSVFCSFILINKVKATVGGTSLQYSSYSLTYEQQVNAGCWYSFGTGKYFNTSYDFYLCSSNKSVFGYKLSGAVNLLSDLYVTEFDSSYNFNYTNVMLWSNNNDFSVILSEGNLPTFGGTCTNGSYCFSIINSGSQGNYRSATANSRTIHYTTAMTGSGVRHNRIYDSGQYFGTGNPSINMVNGTSCNSNTLVYSSENLYNQSDIQYSCNFSLFEFQSLEPDYDYEIMEGTDKGKRVLFEFENFNENSYITVVDMSSGNILKQEDLKNNEQFDIDNISYDSIFYYEIFNDDELVDSGTINVYSDFLATGQPIIRIDLLTNEKTSVLSYEELNDDYILYYAINDDNFINLSDNPENLEIANLGNSKKIFFPNTGVRENNNYVLRGRITDSNGRILYDIGYNVVFFPDKPYFSFSSSYNSTTGANEVEITLHNFQNNDIVYYSYDNINFTQFDNINVNKLEVYSDTDIYTKVVRGNNTYYGFYHVNLNGYNNSSNSIYDNSNGYDDNLFTGFKNLFTGVDMSFLSNISSFFNALKGSYVFRFVMLCITGALILFIMRMIRR